MRQPGEMLNTKLKRSSLLPRWWRWAVIAGILTAWQLRFIHLAHVNGHEFGILPAIESKETQSDSIQPAVNKSIFFNHNVQLRPISLANDTKNLRSMNNTQLGMDLNLQTKSNSATQSSSHEVNVFTGSTEMPFLVYCDKLEEFLLPIEQHFKLVRLLDANITHPPWNATTLIMLDEKNCGQDPYVQEQREDVKKLPT
ncbi:hypothetical protein ACHAWO_000338 [Cyclotella atomus]|uniref:Uncharacterized protein n=1 Tax=Cyclotella atomus TaxID=382360 RepID=A0ABD3N2I1_9STRA